MKRVTLLIILQEAASGIGIGTGTGMGMFVCESMV